MVFDPPLPSTYYRVTSRALILDDQERLIVAQDDNGGWQLPGGGLEHDESFEDCLKREVREELGVDVIGSGNVLFVYAAPSSRGHVILRLAARVTVDSYDFKPGDDIVAWKSVSKTEFMTMEFIPAEGKIHDYIDLIWPVAA